MDFFNIPDILITEKDYTPRPHSLREYIQYLELSYHIFEHPIFKNWKEFPTYDPFAATLANAIIPKILNRTIIERTLAQSHYFASIELDKGVMTLLGKGDEMRISDFKTYWIAINDMYNLSQAEKDENAANIHFFLLQISGFFTTIIKGFLENCNLLNVLIIKESIDQNLKKAISDTDKKKFLLRHKTNFLKQKDQFDEKSLNEILEFLNLEIDFLLQTAESDFKIDAVLVAIVKKFIAEQQANASSNKLLEMVLNREYESFSKSLIQLVLTLFSYHDISNNEPEKVYHAFLLGIFNSFSDHYTVISNKEAGLGRFDVILIPRNTTVRGIIIEVKKAVSVQPSIIAKHLADALEQIENKKYDNELLTKGVTSFVSFAMVFFGKELFINHKIHSPI